MGYQNQDYRESFQLGTATFNAVGGTGMHIQSLKPEGDNADGAGSLSIQTLDELNRKIKMFFWLTDDDWGTDDGDDGWFEDKDSTGTSDLADYTFQPGEGFLFCAAAGACQLNVAGEVKYPTEIAFREAFQLGGNFLPIPLSIQDLKPTGSGADGAGSVSIQTLNELNQKVKMFFWLTDDDWGTDDGDDGWFEDKDSTGTSDLADYIFQPGEGFLFSAAAGALTLEYPELSL